ncbi:MAG: serine hydrolase domain-containing protein [Bacteroidota bacterium]
MNSARKIIISLILLTILISCTQQTGDREEINHPRGTLVPTEPKNVGMSAGRLARIDSLMNRYMENEWLPGSVAFIARKGNIAYHKSFGMRDVEEGDPMEKDDIFRIASMTKAVTTVAILMLYEEGHFLLDEPVHKFIPEFKDPEVLTEVNKEDSTYTSRPADKQITLRHLLTHTSGIGYGFSHPRLKILYDKAGIPDGLVMTDATLEKTIPRLAQMPLLHEPGEDFTYGLNTDVLGYLVEVISGKSLKQFFRERIFEPLEMNDTYFYLKEDMADRLVTLYAEDEEGLQRSEEEAYNYPLEGDTSYHSGGAGLLSTAHDYGKFIQMLVNKGTYNGHRLLSPKTIELMTKDHVGDLREESGFGLGFGITTREGSKKMLSSAGNYWWGGYFSTSFWIDPLEDLVAVLMTQKYPDRHGEIHDKFKVLTYQAIVD